MNWLALREPLDQASRSKELTMSFVAALGSLAEPVIMDIAGGTAANFRMLAPEIARNQHWRLLDNDPMLLQQSFAAVSAWALGKGWTAQRTRDTFLIVHTPTGQWSLSVEPIDVAASVEDLPFDTVDAVVTSAFLDLVSYDWVERIAKCLSTVRRPFFATLNVDGQRLWSPAHRDDDWIESIFQRHQLSDKGFGPSLGIGAAAVVLVAFEKKGFKVNIQSSDWLVDALHSEKLLAQLLMDAMEVSIEAKPNEAPRIQEWYRARQSQIERRELCYTVGHLDLLALP